MSSRAGKLLPKPIGPAPHDSRLDVIAAKQGRLREPAHAVPIWLFGR